MCVDIAPALGGLSWTPGGFIGFDTSLQALAEEIDRRLLRLAAEFGAEAHFYGPLLPVRELRRIDYFSSFPHLVTFPASPTTDSDGLRRFGTANATDATGPLRSERIAPVECVLAPAACYAVYIGMQGAALSAAPQVITVRGTCFRNEHSCRPLLRQPSFSMREIVHLGDAASVQEFLAVARTRVLELAAEWQLAASIAVATDPFFDPARAPKYIHARMFPTKHELVRDGVALASFNNHRNFFGEAFGIGTAGKPAHSACVAFGIERWMAAVLARHGCNPTNWPADAGRLQVRP